MPNSVPTKNTQAKPEWYLRTAEYARPDTIRALGQVLNTLIPYLCLMVLMYESIRRGYPYGMTLCLAVPAAGLFARIFIFFHDCTHGSFLPSQQLNRVAGYIFGILTFTPFDDWRRTHAGHHVTAGDLDRRGMGDVWLLTVEEYRAASWEERLAYRLYRNPLVMFGLGPGWVFLLRNRLPFKGWRKRDLVSVVVTNVGIVGVAALASLMIGFRTYVAIQLPVLLMAATAGVWLFYVQHNFVGAYWARHPELDPMRVALEGSSFYRLPKPLQWMTGNIGLHHIHHIRPGIPNYHLQQCLDGMPELQVPPLTIRGSLRSLRLRLLDEQTGCLVGFGAPSGGVGAVPGGGSLYGAFTRFLRDMWNVFLLHAVVAHVPNGLIPVGCILLLVAFLVRNGYVERTVLHLLLVVFIMIPVSFVSGVRDWRKRFHGGRAPVFYKKIWLSGLLFLLVGVAVAIRVWSDALYEQPQLLRWVYAGCVFISAPVVVMLGHYGAKLVSVRK